MKKFTTIQSFPLFIRNHIRNFGSDRISKNLISLLLAANLFYTVIRYSREITAGGNPYLTGDWLINYEGGYNGRGLFGQVILWISALAKWLFRISINFECIVGFRTFDSAYL